MRAAAYVEMLRSAEKLALTPDAKRAVLEMIYAKAREAGIKALAREERINHARHLLDQGVERPIICERLMTAYKIEKTTAYRDIGEALQAVPNPRDFSERGAV